MRVAVACKRCGQWLYAEEETRSLLAAPCPVCGGQLALKGQVRLDGTAFHAEERMACNDVCQGAKGIKCNCKCEGKNHGNYFTVTVVVEDGAVRLDLADAARLAKIKAKNLPLIEQAEALVTELVEVLETRHAQALVAYRAGEWLPAAKYEEIRAWGDGRGAIRKAMACKMPATRVKKLEALKG